MAWVFLDGVPPMPMAFSFFNITNRLEEINWGRSLGFSQSLKGEPLLYQSISYYHIYYLNGGNG